MLSRLIDRCHEKRSTKKYLGRRLGRPLHCLACIIIIHDIEIDDKILYNDERVCFLRWMDLVVITI